MSISAEKRRSLPANKMGLPDKGAYPTDTPGRATAAKGRSKTALKDGRITSAEKARIDHKANMELYGAPTAPDRKYPRYKSGGK